MNSFGKGFISSILIFIGFVILYHLLAMDDFLIDDGVLTISRIFLGYIHWIYVLPLFFYWRRQKKNPTIAKGFLISSIFISLLNTGLILWILIDPSQFI